MTLRPWLAALVAAASCSSARVAPTAGGAAAPRSAAAGADGGYAGVSEAAAVDPAAGDAGAVGEDAAPAVADPAELLLRAARERKQRLESALAPEAAAREAQACADFAHRSWAQRYPAAAAELDSGHPAASVYAQVADAEALYLEAVCAAAWARTQGFTQLVERRVELGAGLRRAAALAPALDAAGPERELGRLLAALPTYAGGDLAEARRSFEAAIARAPQAAVNRLAYARSVGVKAQDRALFEAQLKAVAAGDDKPAAAEAAELLSREDDLFGPAEAAQPMPGGTQK